MIPVIDNEAIRQIASLTQELVEMNKTTSQQTKVMIRLTWVIAGLTIVLAVLALIQIFD